MSISSYIRHLRKRAWSHVAARRANPASTPAPTECADRLRGVVTEQPLRILLATARYLPGSGGTEVHTRQVALRLAARGADVTVLSTSAGSAFTRESHDGQVRVILVRAWPPGRDYYFAPALVRTIRRGRMDIVHCQGYHTFVAPLVMLAALSVRVPYVVTLHSGGHSSRLRRAIRPVQARLLRPLLCRASQLIASSSFEADLFARRTRIPPSSFVVIPSGVDLPATAPAPPPTGPPLLLSIGRLESYKGHHRVIQALPALDRARPGIRLRIVGTGPYEGELRDLAARLGVTRLLEISPIPADHREEMAQLLRTAGCVLMLSEYESQGLAIQEALSVGCPLVISDTSALRDLARHPNVRVASRQATGDEIAATVIELLDAPVAAPPAMSTWEQCTAALLDVYRDALAARR